VRDRIVQAAVRIVLEPIFEADMLDCSFGFRVASQVRWKSETGVGSQQS
jgi:retron-type reverse transcriptase